MRKKLLIVFLIFFQFIALAQVELEHAWVYLADKENVTASIENPISILTIKAVERKTNQGILFDERDVPVNESYISQLKAATGITVLAKSKWMNAVHVLGTTANIEALLSNFSFISSIQYANGNISVSKTNKPQNKFEIEDTAISFNYGNTQNQVEMLNLHYLHQDDFTGEGILIAVLDAGFPGVNSIDAFSRLRDNGDLLNGYDFVNRTSAVYDYTGNTHGTRVLSTMAAYIQDQFVGTSPDASYYLFRTEDAATETPVEESYWVEAAERADSLGVDIINTSLGYKGYDNASYSHTAEDLNGYSTFITRGANIAFDKGILLVNSAGNSGASGVNAPADSPFVVTVGAVTDIGEYSTFSSQGSIFQPTLKPNVSARGSGSSVVNEANAIGQNSGTSLSSPILAGALACLKQALPNSSNQELIDFMQQSASQYLTPDYFLGYGIPNFQLAIGIGLDYEALKREGFQVFPNPIKDYLNVQFFGDIENANVTIYDILGKHLFTTVISKNNSTVDFSTISNGVYIVRIKADNKKANTFKLIKE